MNKKQENINHVRYARLRRGHQETRREDQNLVILRVIGGFCFSYSLVLVRVRSR